MAAPAPIPRLAKGTYQASTLSKRHQQWGHIWAQQGYLAILVDGFGPRGYPNGFPRFSYDSRPEELNEVTVRPLDAYGALAYLRTRSDVVADRIALQGWSNGGSATLATMSMTAPGITAPTPATGFRAGLAFYPACGLKGQFPDGIKPYAPVQVLQGSGDEEVSPKPLRRARRQKPGDRRRHPVPALSRCGPWFRRSQLPRISATGQRTGNPRRHPARDCVLCRCVEAVAPYNPLIIPALIRSRLKRLASAPALQS